MEHVHKAVRTITIRHDPHASEPRRLRPWIFFYPATMVVAMEIRPFDAALGAEVIGLDMASSLDRATRAEINRAFVDNIVLCFRGQRFAAPDDFLRAAGNLGAPMAPTVATFRLAGHEVIEELTNHAVDPHAEAKADPRPLRRGGSWHTDHSNLECPPKATVLHAIDVPARGGDTQFTNMAAVFDSLDGELRAAIWGKRGFHAYLSRRAPRRLLTRSQAETEGSDGCWQPLARRHPENGRISLYLNPMRDERIEGLDQASGDALFDRLYAQMDEDRFRYSHQWRPGDMLIWDNRAALHQATFDFDPTKRRYLHRIMLEGERPILAD